MSWEDIKEYFLKSVQSWPRFRWEIINNYVKKILDMVSENPNYNNDPFIAWLILDFLPYMSQEFIAESSLNKKQKDNLLLLKEFKHNLAIIEKSNWFFDLEFMESKIMYLYKENQDNQDINFIMWEYMLKNKLFPEKMRECFKKALKWNTRYFEPIHKIFLSNMVDMIKKDRSIITDKSYSQAIEDFPFCLFLFSIQTF